MHYIYLGGIYKEEHAFGKESFWLFCKWFWKAFENHCEQRNMRCISHITNHCFPSSQLAWARVKINLGGGCASTGLNTCNDTKSHWVAFTSKKMRLEQNLLDCTQWELKTQFEKKLTNKYTANLFLFAPTKLSLFPRATRKINLGVGVLVWDPMGWIRWDCLDFLHTVPPSAAAFAGRVKSCVWAWLALLEAICSWNFGYLHPYIE